MDPIPDLPSLSQLGIVPKLLLLLQLLLVVHVIRSGRPLWWIWILLMAPWIGGGAYLLLELLPELQLRQRGSLLDQIKPRSWVIRELQQLVDERDLVETRSHLARELALASRFQEAEAALEPTLQGVSRDDAEILLQAAELKLELNKPQEAEALLNAARPRADRFQIDRVNLLQARADLCLSRPDQALERLRSIEAGWIGDAVRFYLAEALDASGNPAEARTLWQAIRTKYRQGNRLWRRTESRWYRLATARLRNPKPSPRAAPR